MFRKLFVLSIALIFVEPAAAGGAVLSGTQLWVARYNGPTNSYDIARSLAVSPRGNRVFVTGSSASTPATDYATVAYNPANGRQVWVARYNGAGNYSDDAYDVAVSPDGSKVFVTGDSDGGPSSVDYATVAYNAATGKQLWVARYNGGGSSYDIAVGLSVSSDGTKVFVTGESGADGGYATVAYNTANGTQLWIAHYIGPANDDRPFAVRVSPDGTKVFVTGFSFTSTAGTTDYATVAYNTTTGAQSWVKRYNGPANGVDNAYHLGVSPDSRTVFVTGESYAANGYPDYLTVAYDALTGSQQWTARYNGPGNSGDSAASLAVSPDGARVFVTGASANATSGVDFATIAYNTANGAQQWIGRHNGGAGDLTVSPDGAEVFVTGASVGATSYVDYATVAYDATNGTQQWAANFNGPGNRNDYSSSIGVSRRGDKVFVTGYSDASTSNASEDYATVAYRS
jgi:hypothetical protein